MTITRQYSLPNCQLVLEGIGDDVMAEMTTTHRPVLSMLMNVECYLLGRPEPLTGGQDFLNGLVATVSNYAQEFLSGVSHPSAQEDKGTQVQLKRINPDTHRLLVYPEAPSSHTPSIPAAEPIQVDLKTVQLFDLVEAVDQLCADAQTLPGVLLNLKPVSRRHTKSQEPVAQRAVPAAIGISGLAVAAGLLFLVPVPEFKRPEPAGETSETVQPSPDTADGSPPTNPPAATEASPAASSDATQTPAVNQAGASPAVSSRDASPDDTTTPASNSPSRETASGAEGTGTPNASSSPAAAEASGGDRSLENLVASAPVITDVQELSQLTRTLRSKLDEAWRERPSFEEELVYRVGVSAQGDILGFDYENDAAIAHRQDVPLVDLLYIPTTAAGQEPMAEFRVVFTPQGIVQVSPWYGKPLEASPSP